MLLQGYKIYIARPSLSFANVGLLLLLLLLRIGSHLLAEGKVRHFQAGKSSNTNKQDQEQRDDSSKAHEDSWCEVLVPLEQTALVACRVGSLVMCGCVTLQFHLDVVAKCVVHLVLVLLLSLELCLGLCFGGRGGDVDNGVVLRLGELGEAILKELICKC